MWDALGLTAGFIGAILIAVVQSGLFSVIHVWLLSLDFTIETMRAPPPAPIVHFTGVDERMKRAVERDKYFSTTGWILIAAGFGMQLIPHLIPN